MLDWDELVEDARNSNHIFPPIHPDYAAHEIRSEDTAGLPIQDQDPLDSPRSLSSDEDDDSKLPNIYRHPQGPLRVL